MPELLALEGLSAGYGEATVLSGITLSLAEGSSLALLGRNGMGKTTLLNSIVGVTRRLGGSIRLAGRDITALRPDQRAHAGIGWVPQERNIFPLAHRRGKPDRGGAPRPVDAGQGVRAVSAARRAAPQPRQPALRGRAADARDRARADAQPAR